MPPASGSSASSAGPRTSRDDVTNIVPRSAPPNVQLVPQDTGWLDDALKPPAGGIASDPAKDRLRVPDETLVVDGDTVGERTGRRVDPRERSLLVESPGLRRTIECVDHVREAFGIVEGTLVRAPAEPVRAAHPPDRRRERAVAIEAEKRADRLAPASVAHSSGPEPTLAVALAIVEPVVRSVGIDFVQHREASAFGVEPAIGRSIVMMSPPSAWTASEVTTPGNWKLRTAPDAGSTRWIRWPWWSTAQRQASSTDQTGDSPAIEPSAATQVTSVGVGSISCGWGDRFTSPPPVSRQISRGGRSTCSASASGALMRFSSRWATRVPRSCGDAESVVSAGRLSAASAMSSKPTTAKSRPGVRPRAIRPATIPSARMSL